MCCRHIMGFECKVMKNFSNWQINQSEFCNYFFILNFIRAYGTYTQYLPFYSRICLIIAYYLHFYLESTDQNSEKKVVSLFLSRDGFKGSFMHYAHEREKDPLKLLIIY